MGTCIFLLFDLDYILFYVFYLDVVLKDGALFNFEVVINRYLGLCEIKKSFR